MWTSTEPKSYVLHWGEQIARLGPEANEKLIPAYSGTCFHIVLHSLRVEVGYFNVKYIVALSSTN